MQVQSEKIEAYLGNRTLVTEIGLDISPYETDISRLENEGKTVMILAVGGKVKGALAVADVLKKESVEAVEALKKNNIEVWMLTGDNNRTAKSCRDISRRDSWVFLTRLRIVRRKRRGLAI